MLKIQLLGTMDLSIDGETPKLSQAMQTLLAYLLLNRQREHPRKQLAGLLWGDSSEERAQSCLRTALWRLRGILEPDGVPRGTYLRTSRTHAISFNCASDYWLDIERFEGGIQQALSSPPSDMTQADVIVLENALALYKSDLLDGFYYDWVIQKRERLYHQRLRGIKHLMRFFRGVGRYDQALAYGRLILQYDPLKEDIHREMMMILVESGQRALAIRQYEMCRDTLRTELGIEPMDETTWLYHQLLSPVDGQSGAVTLDDALDRLNEAILRLNSAQYQLDYAIQQVEHFRNQQRDITSM